MEFPHEIKELAYSFPNGYISLDCEFFAIKGYEISLPLQRTKSKADVMAMIFILFSYYCTEDYCPYWFDFFGIRARFFRKALLSQINSYCRTNFNLEEMDKIYAAIGHAKNIEVANKFVNYGCKMGIIRKNLPVDYLTPSEIRQQKRLEKKADRIKRRAEREYLKKIRQIEYS